MHPDVWWHGTIVTGTAVTGKFAAGQLQLLHHMPQAFQSTSMLHLLARTLQQTLTLGWSAQRLHLINCNRCQGYISTLFVSINNDSILTGSAAVSDGDGQLRSTPSTTSGARRSSPTVSWPLSRMLTVALVRWRSAHCCADQ